MHLKRNTVYTTVNSDLAVVLHEVVSCDGERAILRASLFNKHNGIYYETGTYTPLLRDISHWIIYESV